MYNFFAATEQATSATAEKASGIGTLGLDFKTFIFQMIAFGIIVFILNKYALPKIFAVIDQRREQIDEGLKNAEAAKAALVSADAEVEKILATARKEATEILSATQKEASALIAEAEEKATRRAKSLVAEAEANLNNQIQAARKALKAETRELVVMATEQILREKIDPTKDAKLVDSALDQAKGANA